MPEKVPQPAGHRIERWKKVQSAARREAISASPFSSSCRTTGTRRVRSPLPALRRGARDDLEGGRHGLPGRQGGPVRDKAAAARSTVSKIHIGRRKSATRTLGCRPALGQCRGSRRDRETGWRRAADQGQRRAAVMEPPLQRLVSVMMLKEAGRAQCEGHRAFTPCDSRTLTSRRWVAGLRKMHPPSSTRRVPR